MKHFFTSLLLLVVAGTFSMQAQSLQKHTLRRAHAQNIMKVGENTNSAWWGYYSDSEDLYSIGTGKTGTYDCAIMVPANHAIAGGKTLSKVRFYLYATHVADVKVWVADKKPSSIDNEALQIVNVEDVKAGLNEVELSSPVILGEKALYIGYSFTVTDASAADDAYPVCVGGSDMANALLLKSSSGAWQDLNGNNFGCLALQLYLEGEFMGNAATFGITDLGECVASIGGKGVFYLPVNNLGANALESIDYCVTADGVDGPEQHVDLPSPISLGTMSVLTLQIDGDASAGIREKTITMTKVNGETNEAESPVAKLTLSTVSKVAARSIVVEEFTGTTCGWCPRGIVAMQKIRDTFGDKAIGIAIHRYTTSKSSDAMYISTYNHVTFGGAPSARINRGPVIDPYYGSGNNVLWDIENELAIPAKVAVSLTAQWNADSTKVDLSSSVQNLLPDATYKVEYVLVADGLKGKSTPWQQHNYYNKAYGQFADASQLPEDLAFLFDEGQLFNNQYVAYYPVFNDVALSVAKSTQTTAIGQLALDESADNSYTLALPTDKTLMAAVEKQNVFAVVLVTDSKGMIVNAAKTAIAAYEAQGIDELPQDGQMTHHAVRYTLDGRQLPAAQKGLNIIRMGDGSVRKVIVK